MAHWLIDKLLRRRQVPEPPDDGFRPSTFPEGYGTNVGDTQEAGGPTEGFAERAMTTVLPRREYPLFDGIRRCESRKVEGKRSWRCILRAGHDVGNITSDHLNTSGGRRWL